LYLVRYTLLKYCVNIEFTQLREEEAL